MGCSSEGRRRLAGIRSEVKREEVLADAGQSQLIGGINLDDRLGGGNFNIAIVVARRRVRCIEMGRSVLHMDADRRFLSVRAQMQMRICKTHRQQRDRCHPQYDWPFAAVKHARSMPESVFLAIGTEAGTRPRGASSSQWRIPARRTLNSIPD